MAKYSVRTYTSDVANAGTDADVFVVVYGSDGETEAMKLDNSADNFERGAADDFAVEGADVGKITSIKIWHSNKGLGSAWHLNKVVITKPSGATYECECDRWLDSDNGVEATLAAVCTHDPEAAADTDTAPAAEDAEAQPEPAADTCGDASPDTAEAPTAPEEPAPEAAVAEEAGGAGEAEAEAEAVPAAAEEQQQQQGEEEEQAQAEQSEAPPAEPEPEPQPEPAAEPEPEPEPEAPAAAPAPTESYPEPDEPPKEEEHKKKGTLSSLGPAVHPPSPSKVKSHEPWLKGMYRTPKGRVITGEELCQSLERMTNAYIDKYMGPSGGETSPPPAATGTSTTKFGGKALTPDEEEAMISRLYTTKGKEGGDDFKIELVNLKYDEESGKEQWVPVKTVSKEEQTDYMKELYERCLDKRKKTQEELAAKYLQPLGQPRRFGAK